MLPLPTIARTKGKILLLATGGKERDEVIILIETRLSSYTVIALRINDTFFGQRTFLLGCSCFAAKPGITQTFEQQLLFLLQYHDYLKVDVTLSPNVKTH